MAEAAADGSKPAEASRRRHLSRSSSPSPGRSNKRTGNSAQADETKRVRRGEKDQKEQDNSKDKSEHERRSNRDRDRERDRSRNGDRDRDRDRHQRSSSRRERDRSRSDKDSRRDRDRDRDDNSCRREHRHREHGEQKKDKDAGSREGHHPERQNTSEQTSDHLSLDEHKAVQPTETVPASEACPPPPPPSTASFAAPKPAQAVGALTAEAKKQLLWSGKRASTDQSRGPPVGTSNHWEAVHFADRERQEKFNKLMGVKSKQAMDQEQPGQVDKHREMQEDLEKQFTAGLRRRDGRTVGLGL